MFWINGLALIRWSGVQIPDSPPIIKDLQTYAWLSAGSKSLWKISSTLLVRVALQLVRKQPERG